jgi:hypothetical protein
MKHFCPGLQSLFDRPEIQIVYAREFAQRRRRNSFQSSMQNLFPVMFNQTTSAKEQTPEEHQSAMTSSKFLAMQSEVKEFYSRYKGQTWKNLLSIGDMPFERDALQEVSFTRIGPATEVVRTKTITVTPNPTISLMVVGLRFRTLLLPVCVHFNGDFDVNFGIAPPKNAKRLTEALNLQWWSNADDSEFEDTSWTDFDLLNSSMDGLETLLEEVSGLAQDALFE